MAQSDIGQLLAQRVEQGAIDVPVFPQSARRIIQACEGDNCDARQLGDIVQSDPALAGHFLRVANSPWFAPRTPIVTLQQALARLGLTQIRQIAVLVAVKTRAFSSSTRAGDAIALRKRSVATAIWAQEIARLRRKNVEEAFLCGLLQDVGAPALWQLAHDVHTSGQVAEMTIDEVDAHVEALHERVGASIVRAWQLSNSVADAIARHHTANLALEGDETLAIVQLADTASRVATVEQLPLALEGHPSITALSLYAEDIEEMVSRASVVFKSIEALA
jgi:putative nucleotidyltransferase with HDIG domain